MCIRDSNCTSVKVHDNIMRVNRDDEGALISIADLTHGSIYDNTFYNYNPGRHGILLRGSAETKPDEPTAIRDLIVEHNYIHELIEKPLAEDTPGVYAKAVEAGCEFDLELSP